MAHVSVKQMLLLLSLTFLFFACSKKELDEIEDNIKTEDAWELNKNFQLNEKSLLNSFADEKELYVLGFNAFSEVRYVGDLEYVKHNQNLFKSPFEYKFPVTATLFPGILKNELVLRASKNTAFGSNVSINMIQIDPEFAQFDFPSYEVSESMGLTSNNVALVPYRVFDRNTYATPVISGSKFLLVKLNMIENSVNETPILVETRIIDNQRNDQVASIATIDNYFYLSFRSGSFVRISENGTIEALVEREMHPVFKHNNVYYGFSYDGLYTSATGNNWTLISGMTSNLLLPQLRQLLFHSINPNTLIATYNSQLFKVDITSKNIKVTELENSGLNGHRITSLAQFNGKVYVTTLSGLFTNEEEKLLSFKEN
jgi:hypothetical protein